MFFRCTTHFWPPPPPPKTPQKPHFWVIFVVFMLGEDFFLYHDHYTFYSYNHVIFSLYWFLLRNPPASWSWLADGTLCVTLLGGKRTPYVRENVTFNDYIFKTKRVILGGKALTGGTFSLYIGLIREVFFTFLCRPPQAPANKSRRVSRQPTNFMISAGFS